MHVPAQNTLDHALLVERCREQIRIHAVDLGSAIPQRVHDAHVAVGVEERGGTLLLNGTKEGRKPAREILVALVAVDVLLGVGQIDVARR